MYLGARSPWNRRLWRRLARAPEAVPGSPVPRPRPLGVTSCPKPPGAPPRRHRSRACGTKGGTPTMRPRQSRNSASTMEISSMTRQRTLRQKSAEVLPRMLPNASVVPCGTPGPGLGVVGGGRWRIGRRRPGGKGGKAWHPPRRSLRYSTCCRACCAASAPRRSGRRRPSAQSRGRR